MGCGKCGSNSCGCASKSCESTITGDMTYDGTAFVCANEPTLDVISGDKLNSILQNMFPVLCLASEKPNMDEGDPSQAITLLANQDISAGYLIPVDGTYELRAMINYSIDPQGGNPINLDANIAISSAIIPGYSSKATGRIHMAAPTTDAFKGSFCLETKAILNAGETVKIFTGGVFLDPSVNGALTIERYSMYAKRVE